MNKNSAKKNLRRDNYFPSILSFFLVCCLNKVIIVLEINGNIFIAQKQPINSYRNIIHFHYKKYHSTRSSKIYDIYLFEAIANRMITTTGKTRQAMQIMSPANVLSLVMYHTISEIIQFQEHSAVESTALAIFLGSPTSTFS